MQIRSSQIPARPRFFLPPRIALVTLALGASALLCQPPLRAAEEVYASTEASANGTAYRLFYDKLGDGGDWIQTAQYGYVFQPRVAVDRRDWRPYTDGYWAQTDAGWTWVSNEDFGWATYHYGHWANVVDTGWVWVPGDHWSPGNVSWRVSRDHKRIGWAPLPPEARLERGETLEGWVDTAYDIGPEAYVFIDTDNFGETSYRSHLIPQEQNVTIITETENITRVSYRDVESTQVIYNGGPDVTYIRGITRQPVRQLALELRPEREEYFQREDYRRYTNVNGNRLVVATAAPEVVTSTAIRTAQPARVSRRLDNVEVDRGYRGLRDPQTLDRVRAALRSQSPPPPPQAEQRAAAALRRTGSAVPPPAPGGRNGPPGPGQAGAPSPAVNPREGTADRPPAGASPALADRRERPGQQPPPPAPPGVAPAPGAPRPGETPDKTRPDRHRPDVAPEGAHPTPPGGGVPAPAPRRESDKPDQPPQPARPDAASKERPQGERPKPPGVLPRENPPGREPAPDAVQPKPDAPKRQPAAEGVPDRRRETPEGVEPRRPEPPAVREGVERKPEPPAAREGAERKPQPSGGPEAAEPPKRAREERPAGPGAGGQERHDKKDAPEEHRDKKENPKP